MKFATTTSTHISTVLCSHYRNWPTPQIQSCSNEYPKTNFKLGRSDALNNARNRANPHHQPHPSRNPLPLYLLVMKSRDSCLVDWSLRQNLPMMPKRLYSICHSNRVMASI